MVDRQLGYPLLAYPARSATPAEEVTWASALTAKYAGVLLLESDAPEVIYPLLTLPLPVT